jgi:DNA uptake protein ComE-like DNA-binding protein
MKFAFALLLTAMAVALSGCTPQQQNNPQELKEKTAQATATLKADAQAVAEGVREGWSRDHPLDLNSATHDELKSLPGISDAAASRIIAHRPYRTSNELVNREVISQAEYNRISDRVTAK